MSFVKNYSDILIVKVKSLKQAKIPLLVRCTTFMSNCKLGFPITRNILCRKFLQNLFLIQTYCKPPVQPNDAVAEILNGIKRTILC